MAASRMAGTGPQAVIVAHGSPADPLPQEAALAALAASVGACLPGWTLRGATLAAEGSLDAALEGLAAPLIYPFFMAEGWFTGRALPRRLNGRGVQLLPFGTEPALQALTRAAAREGAAAAGIEPARATLVLAAHGSQVSHSSKDTTLAMVAELRAAAGFAEVVAGFVEQDPRLADVARGRAGLCLPFFALTAGHVAGDVPAALAQAGFDGPLLPPVGAHPGVPGLIAASLERAAQPIR